jgi:hypothetical protein
VLLRVLTDCRLANHPITFGSARGVPTGPPLLTALQEPTGHAFPVNPALAEDRLDPTATDRAEPEWYEMLTLAGKKGHKGL